MTFEQIVEQVQSRLCAQNRQIREAEWRRLLHGLRVSGRRGESAEEGIIELLSVVGGRGMPPSTPPIGSYQHLSQDQKRQVHRRYQQCLEAAQRDFPYLFHAVVINFPAWPADVASAGRVASRDLPRLTRDAQMEAKEWGIPNDEFARGVLAKQYSAERYSFYAERCWYLLMEAGREHSVDKVDVIYDVSAGKFFCELWRGAVSKRFALDARLVSEPFERGDMAALDHAKESIRFAVEQVFEQDEHLAELRTGP